jgi:hypothetical protein
MKNSMIHRKNPILRTVFSLAIFAALASTVGTVFYFATDQINSRSLPIGQIILTTNYSQYVVGETVEYTIENNYNSSVYIENSCPNEPLAVYKLIDNQWIRQHSLTSEQYCPAESRQISIAAGQSMTGSFKAWPKLFSTTGKYRIVASVEYYNLLQYKDIEIISKTTANISTSSSTTETTKTSDETSTVNSINYNDNIKLNDD